MGDKVVTRSDLIAAIEIAAIKSLRVTMALEGVYTRDLVTGSIKSGLFRYIYDSICSRDR